MLETPDVLVFRIQFLSDYGYALVVYFLEEEDGLLQVFLEEHLQ